MAIFRRIFKMAQAESHAALDQFEDPIKLTEQGIRDLNLRPAPVILPPLFMLLKRSIVAFAPFL